MKVNVQLSAGHTWHKDSVVYVRYYVTLIRILTLAVYFPDRHYGTPSSYHSTSPRGLNDIHWSSE